MWNNIPTALKERNQWCISSGDKVPKTVINGQVQFAKVNDSSTWMPFADAVAHATRLGFNLGYVLSPLDPFTCIDLDVKDIENCPNEPHKWTSQEQYDLYYRIMQGFDSYTETSKSGKGLHIWIQGNIGKGCRRDGVEVYSQERYIICTGTIVQNKPIKNQQTMLENMVSQMRQHPRKAEFDEALNSFENEQEDDDWYILGIAADADNSDKFLALYNGDWAGLGYPSQSEADTALMSMFAFYSNSNEQCRRLFRASKLGQREKAIKNDVYLNRTLALIRSRQIDEKSADVAAMAAASEIVAASAKQLIQPAQPVIPTIAPTPAPVAAAKAAPVGSDIAAVANSGIPWPPGFAGKIAEFIFRSAPRPVKEVAIVAALGLLSGICGKAWHVQNSGLNMYIILVAKSAIGKEAMHSGIAALVSACVKKMPIFYQFVDFKEYASGPALIKACASNPCFVNVCGEWGRKLKRMADDSKDGPLTTLRTQMTNLYQKSGPQSVAGGIAYSDKTSNVESISGVAYSMIGETTPTTFYEALTQSMMEDGFLSRFVIIEYKGLRPPLNRNAVMQPSPALEDGLCKMAFQAMSIMSAHNSQPIEKDPAAEEMLQNYEFMCDEQINETDDESYRQMWNRAALKVLRIAGLLAVADNWITPVIKTEHVSWAMTVVTADIDGMQDRLLAGDVGTADSNREMKIMSICRAYFTDESSDADPRMRFDGIIPRNYIYRRVRKVSSFDKNVRGASAAMDMSIKSLIDNGNLVEVRAAELINKYKYFGKAFRIISLQE